MEPQVITVSQFMAIINETLAFAYPEVTVEGEISSFKINQGKFVFFDLKDDHNLLSCFMMAYQLKLPLEDGMRVRVTGLPKITKFSKFSLTAKSVEIAGEGQLRRAMELLKQKLQAEGLFDTTRKRPLPRFPQRIGLITSATSAAYADFMKILGSRWAGLDIILADISVQGAQAPDQIVGAIEYFNQQAQPVDVLVMIRGGGSLEDLMAFSMEPVARAVAASRTPTIVGVGHEIDYSLADLAADVRAATPTDAARIIVPDRQELFQHINHMTARLNQHLQRQIQSRTSRLTQAALRLESYLAKPRQKITDQETRLWRQFERLASIGLVSRAQVEGLAVRLGSCDRILITERRRQLDHLVQLLHGYSPTAVLTRGYAIVRHMGRAITSSAHLKPGDPLMIQLAQDQVAAEVRPHEQ